MDMVIRAHGEMEKCMEKVCMYGKMEENMKVNILMTKNMEVVNTIGQMARDFKVDG